MGGVGEGWELVGGGLADPDRALCLCVIPNPCSPSWAPAPHQVLFPSPPTFCTDLLSRKEFWFWSACVCLIPPAATTTTTKLINSLDQGQLAGLRLSIPGVLPVTGQVGTMMLPF